MPAYNEALVIGELLAQAVDVFNREGIRWTIVVVDDGSSDETAQIVEEAARRNPAIRLARHERNRGLGPAILTGLTTALQISSDDSALVVCMDADLTHQPAIIPAMRRAADDGADLVIASRFQPASAQIGLSPFRRFLSWGARHLFAFSLGLPGVHDYTCGFRGIRASLLARGFERFGAEGLISRRGFACTDELLIKLALLEPQIQEVPFTLRYDLKRGKSKIQLGVTIAETLRLVGWARRELKARRGKGNR